MHILIVIPLQGERDHFLQACGARGWQLEAAQIGKLAVMQLRECQLTVALGGLGKTQFGVQTQHLIDHGPVWDLVICAGASGALDDRLAVGDVVVGRETVEFDIRNRFGAPLLPRFASSALALDWVGRVRSSGPFKLHVGTIASGDEDVMDAERRSEIRAQTGALVTAWEGAGAARACAFSQVPFVEIRGVSDSAGETAPQDFLANLPMAMAHVAEVILGLISDS
jgi:adenosylhomocysteine nucleosidase